MTKRYSRYHNYFAVVVIRQLEDDVALVPPEQMIDVKGRRVRWIQNGSYDAHVDLVQPPLFL